MQRVQPAVGNYAGTGAALAKELGFKPKLLVLFNETQLTLALHFEGMADASALYLIDTGAGATDVVKITSQGITLTNNGFSVGTAAALNTASDSVWYAAF